MFVFYDWPFPHVYFAKNVAYFTFNSWLSFQRLCRLLWGYTFIVDPTQANPPKTEKFDPTRSDPTRSNSTQPMGQPNSWTTLRSITAISRRQIKMADDRPWSCQSSDGGRLKAREVTPVASQLNWDAGPRLTGRQWWTSTWANFVSPAPPAGLPIWAYASQRPLWPDVPLICARSSHVTLPTATFSPPRSPPR